MTLNPDTMEHMVYGEVQTRDYEGALKFFDTIAEALYYAENINLDVWKISFSDMLGSRHRFVKARDGEWVKQSIMGRYQ